MKKVINDVFDLKRVKITGKLFHKDISTLPLVKMKSSDSEKESNVSSGKQIGNRENAASN